MTEEEQIQDAIREYAAGYNKLQKLQEDSKLIPEGDQKTGAIGEFYAMQYCRKKYKGKNISFGGHSQASWDISIKESGKRPFKIQVKTVSAFAKKKRSAKLGCFDWNELYVIYLDKKLLPQGFWIRKNECECLKTCQCDGGKCEYEKPDDTRAKAKKIEFKLPFVKDANTPPQSVDFSDSENKVNDLRKACGLP